MAKPVLFSVASRAALLLLLLASPAMARGYDHRDYDHRDNDRQQDGVVDNSVNEDWRRETPIRPTGPTAHEISQRRDQERREAWERDRPKPPTPVVQPPMPQPMPQPDERHKPSHYDRHRDRDVIRYYETRPNRPNVPDYYGPGPSRDWFRDRDRVVIRDYWQRNPRYHYRGPTISLTIGQFVPETIYVEPAPVDIVEVLPPIPYGWRYVIAGNNVLLVDSYGAIVDIIDL